MISVLSIKKPPIGMGGVGISAILRESPQPPWGAHNDDVALMKPHIYIYHNCPTSLFCSGFPIRFYVVPGTGLEPVRGLPREILSLLRLPIPPSRPLRVIIPAGRA